MRHFALAIAILALAACGGGRSATAPTTGKNADAPAAAPAKPAPAPTAKAEPVAAAPAPAAAPAAPVAPAAKPTVEAAAPHVINTICPVTGLAVDPSIPPVEVTIDVIHPPQLLLIGVNNADAAKRVAADPERFAAAARNNREARTPTNPASGAGQR